jgi:hypothetical protein
MADRSYRRPFASTRLAGRWKYVRTRNAMSTKHVGNRP